METGRIIILVLMAAIPVAFYGYRLVKMHKMGKMTTRKTKNFSHVKDFSEAFDNLHYEIDESRSYAK
jgi:hypothetical protein